MKKARFDPKNPPPLSPAERRRLARLDETADEDVDTEDIPEVEPEDRIFLRPGRLYRPVKQPITIRLDADVLAWFKQNTEGSYQAEINRVLREHVARQLTRAKRPKAAKRKAG